MLEIPKHVNMFELLGEFLNVPEELYTAVEKFVSVMYGRPKMKDIITVQYDIFCEKFKCKSRDDLLSYDGADLSLHPPCRSSLQLKTDRANFQAYIW